MTYKNSIHDFDDREEFISAIKRSLGQNEDKLYTFVGTVLTERYQLMFYKLKLIKVIVYKRKRAVIRSKYPDRYRWELTHPDSVAHDDELLKAIEELLLDLAEAFAKLYWLQERKTLY